MTQTEKDVIGNLDYDSNVELRFLSGTRDSMDLVYQRFGGLIYSICLKSVSPALAEDVTQQVFISAWKNHEQFDSSRGSLAAWLCGIAKFRIIDITRVENRRVDQVAVGIDDEELPDSHSLQRDTSDSIVEQLVISDAIENLPERASKVLKMSLYEEVPHTEIAQRLALPLGTVKSDIRRGLDYLRRTLGGSFA